MYHTCRRAMVRCGESTRPPPMWPEFNSQTRHHMWVEFAASLLCSALRGFSPGTPLFPSPQKPTFVLISVNFNLQCLRLEPLR